MTMPVEPGIVDTNVLIYALDTAAPQYAAAFALLNDARADAATLFVTPANSLRVLPTRAASPGRVTQPKR